MLELLDKYFKVVVIIMFKDMKENMFLINVKIGNFSQKIEYKKLNEIQK